MKSLTGAICALISVITAAMLSAPLAASSIVLNPGDPCGFDTGCTYLETGRGKDHAADVMALAGLDTIFLIDKSDNGGQTNFLFNGLDTNPSGTMSGSWEYIGDLVNPVVYMTVKAGSQFALYEYEPARSAGFWSTENLGVGERGNQPGMSHLSFFGAEGPGPGEGEGEGEVAEPGSLALLAVGLVGLGWSRRNTSH